jgi:hypothetical protein
MDSRKFHLASASVMIHPRRLHALVTDAPPPAAIARHLESEGVRVVVAAKSAIERRKSHLSIAPGLIATQPAEVNP